VTRKKLLNKIIFFAARHDPTMFSDRSILSQKNDAAVRSFVLVTAFFFQAYAAAHEFLQPDEFEEPDLP